MVSSLSVQVSSEKRGYERESVPIGHLVRIWRGRVKELTNFDMTLPAHVTVTCVVGQYP